MWPFKRRSKSRTHIGPESVSWSVGDVAECIARLDERFLVPNVGDKLLVSRVYYGDSLIGLHRLWGLSFVGWKDAGFDSQAFRKIVLTDTDADRRVSKKAPNKKTERV